MPGATGQQPLRYIRPFRVDGPGSWRFGLLALTLTAGVFRCTVGWPSLSLCRQAISSCAAATTLTRVSVDRTRPSLQQCS